MLKEVSVILTTSLMINSFSPQFDQNITKGKLFENTLLCHQQY